MTAYPFSVSALVASSNDPAYCENIPRLTYMHGFLVDNSTRPHPQLILKWHLDIRGAFTKDQTKIANFFVFVSKSLLTRTTVWGSPSAEPSGTGNFRIPNFSTLSTAIPDNTPTVNLVCRKQYV